MKLEETLCDEVETIRGFVYSLDRVNIGGGCEVAVTFIITCGWHTSRECCKFVHGKRLHERLIGSVYESYVKPATLYGSEEWCLREIEMGILEIDSL